MRLDARRGDIHWTVYHATRCEVLRGVVWVDDCSMQWFQYEIPLRLVDGEAHGMVHDAERILIDPASRLVVIDPVVDERDVEIVTSVETKGPAVVC